MKILITIFTIILFTTVAFGQCPEFRFGEHSAFPPDSNSYTEIIRDKGPTLYLKENKLVKMKSRYAGAWGHSFRTVIKVSDNEFKIFINESLIFVNENDVEFLENNLCCIIANSNIKSCFDYKFEKHLAELDSELIGDITRYIEEFIIFSDKYMNE